MFLCEEGIILHCLSTRHNFHFQGSKDTAGWKTAVKFWMATNFALSIQDLAFEAVTVPSVHLRHGEWQTTSKVAKSNVTGMA